MIVLTIMLIWTRTIIDYQQLSLLFEWGFGQGYGIVTM